VTAGPRANLPGNTAGTRANFPSSTSGPSGRSAGRAGPQGSVDGKAWETLRRHADEATLKGEVPPPAPTALATPPAPFLVG
jgi:hypothetical protein